MVLPTDQAAIRARRTIAGTVAVVAPHGDGRGYLREFSRLGWDCIAVTLPDHERPAAYRDHTTSIPGYSATVVHMGLPDTVRRLSDHNIDLVVAGSGLGVGLTDRIAQTLGLPGNDAETSLLRTNRAVQAETLSDRGIPSAPSFNSSNVSDAYKWAELCHFSSYIVAAADSSVTARPFICSTPDEVITAWSHARGDAQYQSGSGEVVIQEHIPGPHYLIETVSGTARGQHLVSAIWAETRTGACQRDRSDLLPDHGPLTRSLSVYALRVLPALGILHGAARLRVAWSDERGPILVSSRAYAQLALSDEYSPVMSHTAASASAVTGTQIASARLPQAVVRVTLSTAEDGALDTALLRLITTLPTVAQLGHARAEDASACPTADPVSSLNELVLAGDSHVVEADYRAIRSAERFGIRRGLS